MGSGLGASAAIYSMKRNLKIDGIIALDPITHLVNSDASTIILKVPILFLNSSDYSSWIGVKDNY